MAAAPASSASRAPAAASQQHRRASRGAAAASSPSLRALPLLVVATAAAAAARGRHRDCRRRPVAPAAAAAQAPESSSSKAPPAAVYLDDAPTRAFVEWARAQAKISGLGSKVKPANFSGLRGLASTGAAEEGDVLLSVPRASAITLPPKRRCPDGVPPGWWDRAPWYARLAALLLLEKRRVASSGGGGGGGGEASSSSSSSTSSRPLMGPYLATLPQSFREMPYYWTDAQLEALRYPALQSAVRDQRREWRELHAAWLSEKQQQPGAAAAGGGGGGKDPAPPTLAELEWALSAVRSRTFSGPYVASTLASRGRLAALVAFLAVGSALLGGADADSLGRAVGAAVAALIFNVLYETTLSGKLKQYVLCPAIDLLNHSSREGSEATYDYFRDSFSVSAGQGGVAAAGRQVYGSYGAQSNDSLAQYYGFVERDNPNDVYVLMRALEWAEEVTGVRGMAQAAERLGVAGELAAVRVGRGGDFPPEAVEAMRRVVAEVMGGAVGGAGAEAVLAAVLRRELQELGQAAAGAGAAAAAGLGAAAAAGSAAAGKKAQQQGAAPPALAAEFVAEKRRVLEACLEAMVAREGSAAGGAAVG